MFTINIPTDLEGVVIDSSLLTPRTSYLNPTEHYLVTVMVQDLGILDEIDRCFQENKLVHQEFEHVSIDRKAYTITAFTLNKPRLPKGITEELMPGTDVNLRVKLDLAEGDSKSTARVLLVMVGLPIEEEIDWDSMSNEWDF